MNEDWWVQPIAVEQSGTHEEMVAAVAAASILAYARTPDHPAWATWLAGPFTKTVRRGTAGQLALAAALPEAAAAVDTGTATAHGFIPMQYQDMPRVVRKLRVAGIERERTGEWQSTEPVAEVAPLLVVNADVDMSTGKTAAQAAHGTFMWWLRLDSEQQAAWAAQECRPLMCHADGERFREISAAATQIVADAGFTEIAPGTATIAVVDRLTAERLGLLHLSSGPALESP